MTATTMTAPLITVCQNSDTPSSTIPLNSTPMTKAPMIVPPMVPRPPVNEVPPSTTTAIALSSNEPPVAGCAATSCEVIIRPTTACLLYTSDAADERSSVD